MILLKHFHSMIVEGKHFVRDYKFFNRGIYDEPENFDVEVISNIKPSILMNILCLVRSRQKEAPPRLRT